ncbi:MAG: MG2 domain-containing protein [Syntrophobacterales bacterium]|nr:MG2 domain-containing protein [Syntrophobacterales bacterium]
MKTPSGPRSPFYITVENTRRTGALAPRLAVLLIWALALGLLAPAGLLAAQERVKSPPGAAAPGFDPKKHFTIEKIEPDAAQEELRIRFSQPLDPDLLRGNLRLLPRVKIDWNRTTTNPQGVLTLRGAFRYGTGYLVVLPDNLRVGNKTYLRTVNSFFMPDRPPKVEFVGPQSVIERDSRQLLHVRAQNVNNLKFEGIRVPPLLLPLALAVEKNPADWDRLSQELKSGAEGLKPLMSANLELDHFQALPLDEKQLFPAAGEKNQRWAVSLPLNFRQGKEKGVLELIRVYDNEAGSAAATQPRVFQITNLGLTYKRGDNQLLLWVTSLKAGTPMAGARVIGFTKDMEVFPLGRTNADGVLMFEDKDLKGIALKNPNQPAQVQRRVAKDDLVLLMAGTPDDVAFIQVLPPGNLKPQGIWQVKVGEKVRNLKAQVFTERGVYRPGEKMYFKGVVREYDQGRIIPPVGEVCFFEVLSPKGEQVFTMEGRTSDFGTAAGEVLTQSYWPLGTYTLNMTYGPETPAETAARKKGHTGEAEETAAPKNQVSVTFQLQEFKPPRHFVGIAFERFSKTLKDYVNRGEQQAPFVRINLTGSYYAGGPVKHGQVRWKIYQAKTDYQVPGQADFTFGYGGDDQGELIESGQTILDENGRASLEFPLDRQIMDGQHGLSVVATVVDFDGRAASDTQAFQVTPALLVGISRHPDEARADEDQVLKVTVAKSDGKRIRRGAVQAEILQKSYTYVAKRNEAGDLYWDDQEVWRRTVATDLTLEKGTAAFRFNFAWGGRYLVAFTYRDEAGRSFTSATAFDVSGENYAYENRELPYQPLSLAADRAAYKPGETARITARPRSPVSRYLVTLEQNGVLKYQVVAPKGPDENLEVAIRPEYTPNVYVSVLGLTPRGEFPVYAGHYDTEAPNFYWGTVNLSVRQEVQGLKVQISPAAKELKFEPGDKVTLDFTVQGAKGEGVEAELAVAVVDEAVLALTGFKTPALDSLTRFDRPLGVYTGELLSFLVHQTPFYLSKNEPLTGGGGLNEGAISKLRRRFEAVAFFNPSVLTDAQGRAQVTFTLPDNMTTYRVYAVVVDRGSRFASVERPLLATKAFYLEPGLPGFFTKGDTFKFQVAAFNATTAQGPVQFSAIGDGGLFLTAEPPTAPLKPKDSMKLNVTGQAATAGPAAARFAGQFQGRSDAVELKLRVNSGYVRDTQVWFGSLAGTSEIKVPLPPYLTGKEAGQISPQEVTAVLTVAGSPFLRMSQAIEYLLHYPYGCVEQTGSGVLGLAALRGVIQKGLVSGVSLEDTDKFLNRGVQRLLGLQTDSGGFAYWPGQREAHLWGSIYAIAALSLAGSNGINVPPDSLSQAMEYLKNQIKEEKRSPAFKAFACYLLALNDSLERETFNAVNAEAARMDRESKILLLLAAKQAKLRPLKELQTALKPLLGGKAAALRDDSEDGFQARYRAPALALLAGNAILPRDRGTEEEALLLLGGLDRQGIWTSTSDTGWALLALGDYFKGTSFGTEPVEITLSQPGAPGTQHLKLDPRGFRTVGLDSALLLKNPVVKVEGLAGKTWIYKLELTAPRLDIAGTGAAHGFKVSRTIKNTDGSDVIKVGDLVKVTVNMEVAGQGQSYVVLDDPLPAGLLAINSAFKTEERVPEGDEENGDDFDYVTREGTIRFRPNYFEIRDDRVLAFRDQVYSGSQRFEYYCRAVCEGTFVVPATRVAAMYSPGVNGYSAQGKLTIKGR